MSTSREPSASAEFELARERTYGGPGVEVEFPIPVVDLSAPPAHVDEQLWQAAVEVGFFQLANHGIGQDLVERAFEAAEAFFALPHEAKARWARPPGSNSGWEYRTQRRPSTGTCDEKESYQVTTSRMDAFGLWPDESELPGFRTTLEQFERRNWELAMRVLSSFARRLGFADDFFTQRHDPAASTYQCTLRLLHYLPLEAVAPTGGPVWRAGAHTDYDCLTLLHQVPGQPGLQVSPGRTPDGRQLLWTPVDPAADLITCNIGDMLVRWSDDALRSTLHRVRMPRPDEPGGPRFSLAFFAQADTDAIVQGPAATYPPITAGDYLQERIRANFTADRDDPGGGVDPATSSC